MTLLKFGTALTLVMLTMNAFLLVAAQQGIAAPTEGSVDLNTATNLGSLVEGSSELAITQEDETPQYWVGRALDMGYAALTYIAMLFLGWQLLVFYVFPASMWWLTGLIVVPMTLIQVITMWEWALEIRRIIGFT